jgi:hypothetical protein
MSIPSRWTEAEMLRLAARGVTKVDLLGDRGTTLCSMDEIAAMAAVIALSGILPPPDVLARMADVTPPEEQTT